MRSVLQRVSTCTVRVESQTVGKIEHGWLVLVGFCAGDSSKDLDYHVKKIINLRGFNDDQGKVNLSVEEVQGSLMVVSQFTLYGNTKKGNRPSFASAATIEEAKKLYSSFVAKLTESNIPLATGTFQANMKIDLTNDGPVTFMIETTNGEVV